MAALAGEQNAMKLWYDRPAKRWMESLPVGNGRLGLMVFGGVPTERLALSESTFWSGRPSDEQVKPEGLEAFKQIREIFKAGRFNDAKPLIPKMFGIKGNFGTNLPAGDLLLEFPGLTGEIQDYRRELDIDKALASVEFTINGVRYRREVLASHPDGLAAVRLTADKPGAVGFTLRYNGGQLPHTVTAESKGTLRVKGNAFEKLHSDGKSGVAFEMFCRVLPEGGSLAAENNSLKVTGADSVTVLIALNTDYSGRDPVALGASQIAAAQGKSWAKLREEHVADYQRLFRRVALNLGGDEAVAAQPTNERLDAVRKGAADPQLDALFFQYGRYIVIAGSRKDSPLPMHLQGIWNDGVASGCSWTCDYHLDINVEQCYWPTEVANLSECGEPLFRFIASLQAPGGRTAKALYGIEPGWVAHVFTNAWGFSAPGWSGSWGLHVAGGAWIATHLWEHYLFSRDKAFLSQQAYPVLKGAAQFFLAYLYEDPGTGWLLTGPSNSPELGGTTDPGCTHDRAMVHEIFSACIEASRTLNVDASLRAQLEAARAKLPPYKIGRNGQLQEWSRNDDGGQTGHRHTSHLVGLFPLGQISLLQTPELAKAAEKSLKLRIENPKWEDVEWSAANTLCYYARLANGDAAHKAHLNLMLNNSDANLLSFHRGGQAGGSKAAVMVDGNTAGTAGIAEMLLQSHTQDEQGNYILHFLPALPKAWPNGFVKGLRARGGYTVDLEWKEGKVSNYRITSAEPRQLNIRINGELKSVRSEQNRQTETERRSQAASERTKPALWEN